MDGAVKNLETFKKISGCSTIFQTVFIIHELSRKSAQYARPGYKMNGVPLLASCPCRYGFESDEVGGGVFLWKY